MNECIKKAARIKMAEARRDIERHTISDDMLLSTAIWLYDYMGAPTVVEDGCYYYIVEGGVY